MRSPQPWEEMPAEPPQPTLAPTQLNTVECVVPRLTFDANCALYSLNEAGRELFGLSDGYFAQPFQSLFPHAEYGQDGRRLESSARDRLEALVASCRSRSWGEGGVVVQFAVNGELRRAEATAVTHSKADKHTPQGYTLFLLRALPNLVGALDELYVDQSQPDHQPGVGIDLSSMENAVAAVARGLTGIGMTEEEKADPNSFGGKQLNHVELTQLVNEFPHMTFVTDVDGKISYLNKQWYEYTGLPRGVPITVEEWIATVYPEDLAQAVAAFDKGLREQADIFWEYRVKSKHGQFRWMLVMGRPMRDPVTGHVTSFACTITDVDDKIVAQREAEAARLEAERVNERMRTVLSSASVLLLCIDLDANLTFSEGSSAVARSLGALLSESSIGKPLSEVWPDTKLQESVRKMLQPDAPPNLSFRTDITSSHGTKHFQYRLSALVHNSADGQESIKSGLIIVGADITHIIATEAALEQSRSDQAQLAASELAAREASKLKDLFMQTLSHEIRTPISTVSSICELLLGDGNLSKEQRTLVGQALRSSNILLDLVGLVLDLRKVETGSLTLEDNPFVIQDVIEDCKLFEVPCKAKGVEFRVSLDPHLWPGHVLGDRLRLRQILTNGIGNAVKFVSKGSITLIVQQTAETATQVGINFLIKDTGIGISPSELKTLFKPFQQANASTAREFGGTGLGLTIARNLAELMGGTVDLESAPGQGTTMIVKVTLAKRPDVALTDPVAEADSDIHAHRRPELIQILLAEDNDILRQVYTKTLQRMKFNVTCAEDGQIALDLVRTRPFDLVLMDQQMPRLDGLEATKLIRADPNPRVNKMIVISLTAGVVSGNRERCLEAGSNSYLSKPVRANDLEAAIWEQLELGEVRNARIAVDNAADGQSLPHPSQPPQVARQPSYVDHNQERV